MPGFCRRRFSRLCRRLILSVLLDPVLLLRLGQWPIGFSTFPLRHEVPSVWDREEPRAGGSRLNLGPGRFARPPLARSHSDLFCSGHEALSHTVETRSYGQREALEGYHERCWRGGLFPRRYVRRGRARAPPACRCRRLDKVAGCQRVWGGGAPGSPRRDGSGAGGTRISNSRISRSR